MRAGRHALPARSPMSRAVPSRDPRPRSRRGTPRRQAGLSKIGSGHAHNRYAIDVGVALLVLHHETEERLKRGRQVDEELLEIARAAAAQGAISILPHFDALAQEAGIEE